MAIRFPTCSWCVTRMIDFPCSSFLMHSSKICFPTWASTADSGSSSRKMSLLEQTALAKLILCFCPPDRFSPRSPICQQHKACYTQQYTTLSSWLTERTWCKIKIKQNLIVRMKTRKGILFSFLSHQLNRFLSVYAYSELDSTQQHGSKKPGEQKTGKVPRNTCSEHSSVTFTMVSQATVNKESDSTNVYTVQECFVKRPL